MYDPIVRAAFVPRSARFGSLREIRSFYSLFTLAALPEFRALGPQLTVELRRSTTSPSAGLGNGSRGSLNDLHKWTQEPDAGVWHTHNMPSVLRWLQSPRSPPNEYQKRRSE